MQNTKDCKHKFLYKKEVVKCHDARHGWFDAKRVVIYCENCGTVSHDVVNGNSPYSQKYNESHD